MSAPQESVLAKCLAKLERHGALPQEQRRAFLNLPYLEDNFAARETILSAGNDMQHCMFVGAGLISRIRKLKHECRQIVAFNIPGDAPDLQGLLFRRATHDLYTHTPTHIVRVAHADIRALARMHPLLGESLWLETLIEASIFCEWIVNVGQRSAVARIAHLLLEMEARFTAIGQCADGFVLALTQTELSEAVALSLVHMNKSLQKLRVGNLIELKLGRVKILDRDELQRLSSFDRSYLHLGSSAVQSVNKGRIVN